MEKPIKVIKFRDLKLCLYKTEEKGTYQIQAEYGDGHIPFMQRGNDEGELFFELMYRIDRNIQKHLQELR